MEHYTSSQSVFDIRRALRKAANRRGPSVVWRGTYTTLTVLRGQRGMGAETSLTKVAGELARRQRRDLDRVRAARRLRRENRRRGRGA